MSTSTPTAEQIQVQMHQVRTDLREDVRELVESAREMTVWQRYVQAYPWACLGAAALAGYFIVPTRSRGGTVDPRHVADLVASQVSRELGKSPAKASGGVVSNLVSGAMGMAVNGLLNQGVSILGQQLNQYVARSLAPQPVEPHTNGKEH